ncbi:MAG: hypothetical protein ACJ76Z_02055 [Thermoleophilaceae bacterium]
MADEATIKGEGCEITLRVLGFEFPEETTGWDANWLNAVIEIRAGSQGDFRAAIKVSLRTVELASFRDQLCVLDEQLNGQAKFSHLEDQLSITITMVSGKAQLAWWLREHIGARLSGEDFETDQSSLRRTLGELDEIVEMFPVRGDPTD